MPASKNRLVNKLPLPKARRVPFRRSDDRYSFLLRSQTEAQETVTVCSCLSSLTISPAETNLVPQNVLPGDKQLDFA